MNKKQTFLKAICFTFLLLTCWCFSAQAKEFEIFDGRNYNGQYYPRIDVIEWGERPHMEFHVYSKAQPVEITAVPGEKNGKPVLWLVYRLNSRGENICRHVIAPSHFREGDKVYAYKDSSPKDYDNIYVSTHPLTEPGLTEYTMAPYAPCNDEMASNMPGTSATNVESVRAPASAAKPTPAKTGKGVGVDYENQAMPFSF